MRLRNASMFAVGALLTVAAAASAQDTTRTRRTSQQRIPITKEAPGEVAIRVDTVRVYLTDTLRVFRTDTLTTTRMRVDTVRVEVAAMPMPLPKVGGLYFGIAGGASLPAANQNEPNKAGWRLEVPFGIDPIGSPLGLRFNLGYSQWDAHSWVGNAIDNSAMMNGDAALKLRVGHFNQLASRFELYGLAGGSYNRYKNIVEVNRKTGQMALGDQIITGQDPPNFGATADHGWHDKFGFNLGGGASVGWGNANLFVEARYNRFNGVISPVAQVPLVIGFTWF